MKKLLFAIIGLLFALPVSAQVQSQNQIIIPSYGGVIMATSTNGNSKLSASTSPTVNWITATSTLQASTLPYASSTSFTVSGAFYNTLSNGCAQIISNLLTSTGSSCISSSGLWATTSQDYYNSQFRDFKIDAAGSLTSTTSLPFLINNASSTITNLQVINGTTTSATSTNLYTSNQTTLAGVSGNVGIHTVAPTALLDIAGTGASTDFRITRQGNPSAYFSMTAQFGAFNSTNFSMSGVSALSLNNGGMAFGAYSGGGTLAPTNGIILSGKLGIATTSPLAQLDVVGANNGTNPLFQVSSVAAFATTTQLYVASDGKTGVGTSSPTTNFVVAGNTGITIDAGGGSAAATLAFKSYNSGAVSTDRITTSFTGGLEAITPSGLTISTAGTNPGNNSSLLSVGGSAIIGALYDNALVSPPANGLIVQGSMGVGTNTPWGTFAIGTANLAITTPSFSIASSSTGVATTTQFVIVNGKVGIGTTTPPAALTVQGPDTSASTNALAVYSSTAGTPIMNMADGGVLGVGNIDFGAGTAARIAQRLQTISNDASAGITMNSSQASGLLAFQTQSTERMRITSTGNVGIATTSPNWPLSVAGTTTASSFIATSTTEVSNFQQITATNITGASLSTCNGSQFLQWNGGLFACGTPAGSAGVWATTSSDYYNSQFRDWKQYLTGATAYIGPTTTIGVGVFASSTISALTVTNGTTTNATSTNLFVSGPTRLTSPVGIGQLPVSGTALSVTGNTNLTGDMTVVNLTTSGNIDASASFVDIGTLNALDTTLGQSSIQSIDGTAYVSFSGAGFTGGCPSLAPGLTRNIVFLCSANLATGSTLGTAYLFNYNWGIGTTTPNWTGQFSSSTPAIDINDTTGPVGGKHWLISNNDGKFNIGTSSDLLTSTSTYLTINNLGNVGVGTSSPYAKLSIAGSVVAQDFTATSTIATSTFQGAVSIDQGSNVLPGNAWFRVGSSTSNILVDKISGNVGIGTSSPYALLSVYNSTLDTSFAVGSTSSTTFAVTNKGRVGIGTSDPQGTLHIFDNSNSGGFPSIIIGGNNGGDTDFNISRFNTNDGMNNDSLRFGTSTIPGTNPILTLDYTGNIGIGSTSPIAKLSVVGTSTGSIPVFSVATSTGPFGNLLNVFATTTGGSLTNPGTRTVIGTSSQSIAGNLDQLYIEGRVNSSWKSIICDFPGLGMIADVTGDVGEKACGMFSFHSPTPNFKLSAPAPSFLSISNATGNAYGGSLGFGSGLSSTFSPTTTSMVTEVDVYNHQSTSTGFFIGLSDTYFGINLAQPTNGIGFVASSTATVLNTNWYAVVMVNGVATTYLNTNVASSTSSVSLTPLTPTFQKMRLEVLPVNSTQALVNWYIDGSQVASQTITTPIVNLSYVIGAVKSPGSLPSQRLLGVGGIRLWKK